MKHPYDPFDPGARWIPEDWMKGAFGGGRTRARARPEARAPHKWMTTVEAPLAEARNAAMAALDEMDAALAYLYEADEKVVIRCTLPQRQLRAELKPVDAHATRIVVVTMEGADVDRLTSGRLVEAIERKLAAEPHSSG